MLKREEDIGVCNNINMLLCQILIKTCNTCNIKMGGMLIWCWILMLTEICTKQDNTVLKYQALIKTCKSQAAVVQGHKFKS